MDQEVAQKGENENKILDCELGNLPQLLAKADEHNPFQETKALL